MPKRNDGLLLADIIDSCNKIARYTKGLSFEEFKNNSLIVDAVIRNFEVIGEAANQLTETFKTRNSSIEWHRFTGMRNRIIHGYFGVDLEIVWNTINNDLINLKQEIEKLV